MRSLIFSMYLILPATPDPGVYSASNRSELSEDISGGKVQSAYKTDDLTAIFGQIVYTVWEPQHYRTP
jgi:hypothetical protein